MHNQHMFFSSFFFNYNPISLIKIKCKILSKEFDLVFQVGGFVAVTWKHATLLRTKTPFICVQTIFVLADL